ncbi:MAG: hypothetical protein IPK60_20830 [Sandaracinaceae bacterium]|nr:hypothetical protein [Sandaracinaceae bacterium]
MGTDIRIDIPPQAFPVLQRMGEHLDAVVEFGGDVLDWTLNTPGSADHVLASSMSLRALLDQLSAIAVLVRASWPEPALVNARVLLETCLHLEYLVVENMEQRGLCYLYWEKRQEQRRLKGMLTDGSQPSSYHRALEHERLTLPAQPIDSERITKRLATIELSLLMPLYADVAKRWEQAVNQKKRPREWYALCDPTLDNIQKLAKALTRSGIYETVYRGLSSQVHGSTRVKDNVRVDEQGTASVRRLRSPETAQQVTLLAASLSIEAITAYINALHTNRLRELAEWYKSVRTFQQMLGGPPILRISEA